VARTNEGTQEPQETLAKGGGTCRDYALLMIETVRALGFAARFVSG
jgi:transglutaminase-like putative cysteine protease